MATLSMGKHQIYKKLSKKKGFLLA